jgi:Secretion system C-terminal sorting domain
MKKTILSILFAFTINFVFAQNPITIGSTCGTLDYHGVYNYIGDLNGKPYYEKGADCSSYTTDELCSSTNTPGVTLYTISWDGSAWSISSKGYSPGSSCTWLVIMCVPKSVNFDPFIIATNSADTPLPPCSGWNFTSTPACTPTFSNCTTLGLNGFAFQNNIEIFPNPIENDFTIKLKEIDSDLQVSILNSLGQIVISKDFTNSTEMKLNLNQPTGIYFAKITNKENQVAYYKLIKK